VSGAPDPPQLPRLDPDRASAAAPDPAAPDSAAPGRAAPDTPRPDGPPTPPAPSPPVAVDTRRYRWIIGIVGLVLVVGISVYQFATHGVGTTGVPPGQRLHSFAAPLADTNLNGDANTAPSCTPARHDPRALNVCLMVKQGPLALAFFVTGASQCIRQVSALQALAARFGGVQFAAVAIGAGHASVARLVRAHRWTIPVAYDRSGRIGALYQVAACPMVELAARGGVVSDRLIGDRWASAAALAPRIQALAGAEPPPGT
jgi:hypothetical protein